MPANGKKKNVGGWIGSIVLILFAITSFSVAGIISGILFLISGAFVNPICQNLLTEKGVSIKKWMSVVGMIVLILAAILTFPSQKKDDTSTDVAIEETMTEEAMPEKETIKEEPQPEQVERPEEVAAQETEEPKNESNAVDKTEAETETIIKKESIKKEDVSETQSVAAVKKQAEPEALMQSQTEVPPETPTQPQTEAPTEATTQPQTEAPTEAPTQPQTEAQTEAPTRPQTEISQPEEPQPEEIVANSNGGSGEVVYTGHYYRTPSGKCYHYSAECAGKNAYEISEGEAMSLKPCGTCVE